MGGALLSCPRRRTRFDRVSSHRRLPLLPTTVVGSYPQPNWLVDHDKLVGRRLPPRVRMREVWRIPEPYLEEAQDDATLLAIRDLESAGIDIISDGEMRRESYSNHFSNALDGVDVDNPAQGLSRRGGPDILPRIVGPIRRSRPVEVRDVEILRANTDRAIKITVPGPFTMSQQAVDEFYGDEPKLALDYAAALNEEIHDLVAAGADVIQIDEPYIQARVEKARAFAIPAIDRALEGVQATTVLHTCFGYGVFVGDKSAEQYRAYAYLEELKDSTVQQISIEAAQPHLDLSVLERMGDKTIMLGVIDCGSDEVESVETVADRIHAALKHIPPARLVLAPDCGMKYLSRAAAFGKLKAMADAARLVRAELAAAV
jgi:5-methyltetrahydropteroyltriglutamate--homocysteine methyltransferase